MYKEPTIKDARDNLACRHCIGRNCNEYYMSCIILKVLPNARLKILVFGDRNWKGHEDKKQIRYVDAMRVSPKNQAKP